MVDLFYEPTRKDNIMIFMIFIGLPIALALWGSTASNDEPSSDYGQEQCYIDPKSGFVLDC